MLLYYLVSSGLGLEPGVGVGPRSRSVRSAGSVASPFFPSLAIKWQYGRPHKGSIVCSSSFARPPFLPLVTSHRCNTIAWYPTIASESPASRAGGKSLRTSHYIKHTARTFRLLSLTLHEHELHTARKTWRRSVVFLEPTPTLNADQSSRQEPMRPCSRSPSSLSDILLATEQ